MLVEYSPSASNPYFALSSSPFAEPKGANPVPRAGHAHTIRGVSYPPQPPYGTPPPYGYGYPVPPNHPQATTILVLGILGLVCCTPCGPFAWVMGQRALKQINSSGGTVGGHGQVLAGYICGIIATGLLALTVVILVLEFVVFGAALVTHHPAQ
jgi:hypothetical protein